jgi:hypothetical protein
MLNRPAQASTLDRHLSAAPLAADSVAVYAIFAAAAQHADAVLEKRSRVSP